MSAERKPTDKRMLSNVIWGNDLLPDFTLDVAQVFET
jgi:hypothetical protein